MMKQGVLPTVQCTSSRGGAEEDTEVHLIPGVCVCLRDPVREKAGRRERGSCGRRIIARPPWPGSCAFCFQTLEYDNRCLIRQRRQEATMY